VLVEPPFTAALASDYHFGEVVSGRAAARSRAEPV
jgi:hypothetical protein